MVASSLIMGFRSRSTHPARLDWGFTLIEIVIVIAIIGIVSAIAVSNYLTYIERVRVASAVASIRVIEVQLDDYVRSDEPLPATLSEIGVTHMLDPWGHPFVYLPFSTFSPSSSGAGGDSGGSSGSGDSGSSSGGSSGSGGSGGSSGGSSDSGGSGGSSGGSSGSDGSGGSSGDSSGSGGSQSDPDGGAYIGEARKDHFLVPLNSDYDLYSVGKDGESRAPLSVPVSADDVIRANDGAYIGLAANY